MQYIYKKCRKCVETSVDTWRHMFSNFFRQIPIYEKTWINIIDRGRPQMAIWRIRVACWIPKATNTHSEYVILIAFSQQVLALKPLHVTLNLYCVYCYFVCKTLLSLLTPVTLPTSHNTAISHHIHTSPCHTKCRVTLFKLNFLPSVTCNVMTAVCLSVTHWPCSSSSTCIWNVETHQKFHVSPQTTVIQYSQYVYFWRDSPPSGSCLLIHEVSRSHTTTQHSR
jgi:hypothetical protein